ncbi:MAG: ribonuclease E activity regulator RraA [Desulfobacterales bacterium]|nr:ribonuclease E activity regulator RraA [Desulfobacterales bacterium]
MTESPTPRPIATADLCDAHADKLQIARPEFRIYGGRRSFGGRIHTVQVFKDNVLVRRQIEKTVTDAVLVIDGGGSLECALVGDMLAGLAVQNGWQGIVVNGCIRDAAAIAALPIGIRALNTHPLKSGKRGAGQEDLPVTFAGVTFRPGEYLYADEDGMVVSATKLL